MEDGAPVALFTAGDGFCDQLDPSLVRRNLLHHRDTRDKSASLRSMAVSGDRQGLTVRGELVKVGIVHSDEASPLGGPFWEEVC